MLYQTLPSFSLCAALKLTHAATTTTTTAAKLIPAFLKDLKLDYIDMILLHAPTPMGGVPAMAPECALAGFTHKQCRHVSLSLSRSSSSFLFACLN